MAAMMLTFVLNPAAAKKPTKSEQAMQQFRYELECAGNGAGNGYLDACVGALTGECPVRELLCARVRACKHEHNCGNTS